MNRKKLTIVAALMLTALTVSPSAVNAGAAPVKKTPAMLLFDKALTECNNKDYQASIRDYNEAIKLNPKYGEAYGNRGVAKFNSGDYKGALEDYSECDKIIPNNKAIAELKAKAATAIQEQEQASAQQEQQQNLAARQRMLQQAIMGGGDFSDPSSIIMMNAQRRGLVPNPMSPSGPVDYSDPASIIMHQAAKNGLIQQGQ